MFVIKLKQEDMLPITITDHLMSTIEDVSSAIVMHCHLLSSIVEDRQSIVDNGQSIVNIVIYYHIYSINYNT